MNSKTRTYVRKTTPSKSETFTPGTKSKTFTLGTKSKTFTPGTKSKTFTPGTKSKTFTPGTKSKTFTSVTERLAETMNIAENENENQESSSMFSFPNIQNSIMTYGIGLIVLALLGINLLLYLGIYTEKITDFVQPVVDPILKMFGYTLADLTRNTTNLTATGAAAAVDVGKDSTESGVNTAQELLEEEDSDYQELKKSLRNNKKKYVNPEPDVQSSSIQKGKGKEKAGYCLVGKDRGFRSCMKVDSKDVCMSGEIFPSRDLCINPKLRV